MDNLIKYFSKSSLLVVLFLIYGSVTYAQTVTGTVTDASTGNSLAGVNILDVGTSTGTTTDANGHYKLTVSSSQDSLRFSFIGYKTQTIQINGRTNIDIELKQLVISGQQLVVVGFGTQQKRNVTGAISSITSEDFNKGEYSAATQLLQGKVPGVHVTRANGNPNTAPVVHIRGVGSVRTGSQPLYVIDGVPIHGNAMFLNSKDIKSIDVLKDAAATAIYGSRGANGVIEITTKEGQKGAPTLTYNGSVSISHVTHMLDVLNADQFREFQKKYGNASVIHSNSISTNWQNQIVRSAFSQNHLLSYSGGSEHTTYRASVGYKNQKGILFRSRRRNYTGDLRIGQSLLNGRIKMDTELHGIFLRTDNPSISSDGGVSGNLLSIAANANPTYPVRNKDGLLFKFPTGINPLVLRNRRIKFNKHTRILGHIKADVRIIKGLHYTVRFNGGKNEINSVDQMNPLPARIAASAADISNVEGFVSTGMSSTTNYEIEQHLKYKFSINNNSFNLLGGYSYEKFQNQLRNWSIQNFSTSAINAYRNPGIGTVLTIASNRPSGSAHINKLQSLFGRINYNYKDTYLFTFNLRADGSSKFGKNKKYGVFPSFSAGWRLSNESFLNDFNALSSLKLHVGWGESGNQNIPPYITKQLLNVATGYGQGYYFGSENIPGITFVRARNENLHWETSKQLDIGLNFGFFDNRLKGSVDIYNKISSDILFKSNVSEDPIQPSTVFWKNYNGMKIHNKGLELSLDYLQPFGANFNFDIGGNLSVNRNKVTGSPEPIIHTGYINGQGLTGVTVEAIQNGFPMGMFWLKKWIGFDKNGISQYKDVNGDGTINSQDFVYAGSPFPSAIYGFHIKLNYKNASLVMNFTGQTGNKLYWNDQNAYFTFGQLAGGKNSIVSTSKFGGVESISDPANPSTKFLHNASYLRLSNVTIGYNILPGANNNWLRSVRLYVTGQNLFVVTPYPGYDPEVDQPRAIGGFQSFGIDGTAYPRERSFIFGVKFKI
jgi:iron complex outermembrane receptor protein